MTVTHQTGESDYARVSEPIGRAESRVSVAPFLYDMPVGHHMRRILWWRRAGAMTVAELTACGKPAILIPLPTAIYDHQMRNAKVMEAAGAAVVLPQTELTGSTVGTDDCGDFGDPERVRAMGAASMSVAANRCGRGDRPRMLCTHRRPS